MFTAVANAVLLLGVAGFILYEAFERLGDAPDVPGVPMIVVALAGLLANLVVVLLLRSQSERSLAVKGAYMEVVADTVGSVGVLIAGIVTVTTRWPYADVVVAVLVALWVLPRAFSLARAALRILSESSPSHIDVDELRTALAAVDGVTGVHDLHVWTLVPGKDMATAHVTCDGDSAEVLDDARAVLAARGLEHATVQVEPPETARDGCEQQTAVVAATRARARRAQPGSQSSSRSRQRAYSSASPMVWAARASTATQRRKPWFGSCANGTGPKPFHPLRRSLSRPR